MSYELLVNSAETDLLQIQKPEWCTQWWCY